MIVHAMLHARVLYNSLGFTSERKLDAPLSEQPALVRVVDAEIVLFFARQFL